MFKMLFTKPRMSNRAWIDFWEDFKATYIAAREATFYSRRPLPGLFTFFTILMPGVFILCLCFLYVSIRLDIYGVTTIGTITSYQDFGCFKNQEDVHETILFLTSEDLPVTFDNPVELPCDSSKHDINSAVGIGKNVQVLYNSDDPQEAEISSSDNYWQKPIVSIIGILFSLSICSVYVVSKIRFIKQFRQIRQRRKFQEKTKQSRTTRKIAARTSTSSQAVRYTRKGRPLS